MEPETGTSKMMRPIAPWDGFFETWSGMVAAWEVKATAGAAFAAVCSFLDIDQRIDFFLCLAIIIDFFCGVADAIKRKRFRCRAVAFGITKIFWYIIYLGIVSCINQTLSQAFWGFRMPLLDLFVAYLVASDCVSITGHLQSMGVPVPPLLKNIASWSKKATEKKTEKILKKVAEDTDVKPQGEDDAD